ncbi:phenylalanine--tRNA ligase beta subunit-related protein [Paraliomyxa miuraensis]|uniref:phenylalanine--tRNA ligase beta subunit-related protein n=1 Tax=Paraliomyxa miuraensis TaxID=376150 RepID=UPI00225A513A|nr:phenylalanine--tRNA ligase beta subunit-related protein [Paraliomyxa miuraensis]MCX4246517.1 phenylalanine--tRNA ligase beta subunit-related protein [Paraliomyxa miuraensis]
MVTLAVDEHPLLALEAFVAHWTDPVPELPSPTWLETLRSPTAETPLAPPDDTVQKEVRNMLRQAGYKPSGRGKPASEYLRGAAAEGGLAVINLAVDLGNVVSLHSGLPISVVDLDRLVPPLRVRVADEDAAYVFNSTGQEIRLRGLLCLHDANGPCANAVKDAMRTKTNEATRRVLCLLWGANPLAERGRAASHWHRELCERSGASIEPVDGVG